MIFSHSGLSDHLLYLAIVHPLYSLPRLYCKVLLVHLQRCNVDHCHIVSYRPNPKLFAVSLFKGISTPAAADLVFSLRSYQVPLEI
jgi:hypothetical protein